MDDQIIRPTTVLHDRIDDFCLRVDELLAELELEQKVIPLSTAVHNLELPKAPAA